MGALVYIGSNNNHGGCLLHIEEVTVGPVGGHSSVGAVATLLSGHAGRSFTPGADTTSDRQPLRRHARSESEHQVIQTQPPQRGTCHTNTERTLAGTPRFARG